MSRWTDKQKFSAGELQREEDKFYIPKSINSIMYVGTLDKNSPPVPGHLSGSLYIIRGEVELAGQTFYDGDFVLDTGTDYVKVAASEYIGQ